jgi:hypothetical protein
MTPTAALDPQSGKVHVVWTENRGNVGQVAWALCDAGGARCGANEAVSDKPFASYAFVRHSTRWLGEYYSLVVDARRKRLHVVWTQTVDEGGQPIARIFHAAGKL